MLDYDKLQPALERTKERMRPYQIKGTARGLKSQRILLDMTVGLGKTVVALTVAFGTRPRRILILCGQAALGTWLKEIKEWYPEFADPNEMVVIKAKGQTAAKRKAQWKLDKTYYVCTKETFIIDQDVNANINFDVYIIDEAHKVPAHSTKTFKTLEKALRDVPTKIMLSGTWIKRHAGRGWRQLHMLNRKAFPSYWQFVNRYCIVIDNGFGKTIVGPKNTEEFYHNIAPYTFRHHDIEGNVPPAVRKLVWVNMNKEQRKIYDDLAEQMFTELESGDLLISKVSLATFTKHRQVMNCPRILDGSLGLGEAFEKVLEHLKEAEEDEDLEEMHCVIFSPFKTSIPFFAAELEKRGFATFTFIGGTDGMLVQKRSQEFRALKGKKSIALCTIDFAESFQLGTATRSHFLGLHHDGDPMKQAEGRLARADSDLTKTIVHRYWLYNDTMDEDREEELRGRAAHVRKLFYHVDTIKETLRIGKGPQS